MAHELVPTRTVSLRGRIGSAWRRLGNLRAVLAGGAVLGGAKVIGVGQVALILIIAYRTFHRREPAHDAAAHEEVAHSLAHRLTTAIMLGAGHTVFAVRAAEAAATAFLAGQALQRRLSKGSASRATGESLVTR